jgi:hypothetical protein
VKQTPRIQGFLQQLALYDERTITAGLSAIRLKNFALPALTQKRKNDCFEIKRDSCVIKLRSSIVLETNPKTK